MLKKINIVPRWIIFLIDIAVCNFCMIFAYLIGHNLDFDRISVQELYSNLLVLSGINTLVFLNFRSYAGIVRYTGVQDAIRVSLSLLVSVVMLALLSFVTMVNGSTFISLPVATLIIYSLFSFLGLISYRVIVKYDSATCATLSSILNTLSFTEPEKLALLPKECWNTIRPVR